MQGEDRLAQRTEPPVGMSSPPIGTLGGVSLCASHPASCYSPERQLAAREPGPLSASDTCLEFWAWTSLRNSQTRSESNQESQDWDPFLCLSDRVPAVLPFKQIKQVNIFLKYVKDNIAGEKSNNKTK